MRLIYRKDLIEANSYLSLSVGLGHGDRLRPLPTKIYEKQSNLEIKGLWLFLIMNIAVEAGKELKGIKETFCNKY